MIETAPADVQERKAAWTQSDLTSAINRALPDYLGVPDGAQIGRLLDQLTADALAQAAPLDAARPGAETLPDVLRRTWRDTTASRQLVGVGAQPRRGDSVDVLDAQDYELWRGVQEPGRPVASRTTCGACASGGNSLDRSADRLVVGMVGIPGRRLLGTRGRVGSPFRREAESARPGQSAGRWNFGSAR